MPPVRFGGGHGERSFLRDFLFFFLDFDLTLDLSEVSSGEIGDSGERSDNLR